MNKPRPAFDVHGWNWAIVSFLLVVHSFAGIPTNCVAATAPHSEFQRIDAKRHELLSRIDQLSAMGRSGLGDLVTTYKDLYILDYDDPRTRLGAALAMQNEPDEHVVEILYDMVLGRKPKDEEPKKCTQHMVKHADDPRRAIEDIIWALCNTKEFIDRVRK